MLQAGNDSSRQGNHQKTSLGSWKIGATTQSESAPGTRLEADPAQACRLRTLQTYSARVETCAQKGNRSGSPTREVGELTP